VSVRLGQFIEALGGTLEGNPDQLIARLAPLEAAGPQDLSFLSNPRYQQQLAASQAACVIVAPAMREPALQRGACIVADDPYVYFARATQWWKRQHVPAVQPGVHPSAVVHPDAVVDASACIGPLCVVERGAHIGAHTWLKSRVTVGEDCHIGARCIVHAGAVIGADGFGFAPEKGAWVKIEQLGAVRIGDDVEIGANTCIDRGALGDTVIEDGVKLDNLVQIGHNVRIGRHSAMAGCVGIAGSAQHWCHCTVGAEALCWATSHWRTMCMCRQLPRSRARFTSRAVHRHVSHRRQCALGKERRHAQAAAQSARAHQGPGRASPEQQD
jgi:UDP-3-O-[3-hydroxymyristoyl] glucosamine N-acyltransferase